MCNCCLYCAQCQHIDVYMASLSSFQLFSSMLTYFDNLVCALSSPSLTHCWQCTHNNSQCEQVLASLCMRLNHLFTASDAVAHSTGNLMTLMGLRCLFIGIVYCYCQLQCQNAVVSVVSPGPVNSFSSQAEFSCLVVTVESILDVLHYQVCWASLVRMRWN